MPVLFIGHGSPMNALADNAYSKTLTKLGQELPAPRAILCISAHWMTKGSWLTSQPHPKTIHDFYGFPKPLFDVQYPAPGSPEIAREIQGLMTHTQLQLDDSSWGLDHGTWSVLKHLYPKADIPVIQLSLSIEETAAYHFKLGQELKRLRQEGILIVASGNIVHNLRQLNWDTNATPHAWAVEFDQWCAEKMRERNFSALTESYLNSQAGRLSVPTPEHYYPLLYILGAASAEDEIRFEYEGLENASISMRSVSFGFNR